VAVWVFFHDGEGAMSITHVIHGGVNGMPTSESGSMDHGVDACLMIMRSRTTNLAICVDLRGIGACLFGVPIVAYHGNCMASSEGHHGGFRQSTACHKSH
jgi:hypothetical protein